MQVAVRVAHDPCGVNARSTKAGTAMVGRSMLAVVAVGTAMVGRPTVVVVVMVGVAMWAVACSSGICHGTRSGRILRSVCGVSA